MAREQTAGTRSRDDGLTQALDGLEKALSAEVPGREQTWAEQAAQALFGLEAILGRHVEITEAADGMFSEVDLTRPTLTRQVSHLRQEHQTLIQSVRELRVELQQAAQAFQAPTASAEPLPAAAAVTAVPDFATIRTKGEELLANLKKHRQGEVDVLLESVDTDIGVGD